VFLTPHAEVFEVTKAVVPAAMRSFDVEIPAGFLPDRSQLSAVAWARASGNGWASIGRPLFTIGGWWIYSTTVQDDLEQIREACRTTQPLVPEYYVCWTINRTREMRYLMRLGVSGILTDFPGRLRRLLNRKRRQDDRRMARQARQQARREQRETKGQGLSSASNVR
jgi:hypothetical protein